MRLLIADDEAPLRAWLVRLLEEVAPDAEVVAQAADGESALARIGELRPDAALLDIRMPGLSGLEVAARLPFPCRVVFVTAHDEFAVQAFERAAVDYLLKPVTAERLALTLDRLRRERPATDTALLRELSERISNLSRNPSPARFLRWLRVGNGDSVRLLDVAEVDYFSAADKYTLAHVAEREWPIRTALKDLEQQLDPDVFWRIHRGTLVRVAAVREVRRDLMGRLWLELNRGGTTLAVSRAYGALFRQM